MHDDPFPHPENAVRVLPRNTMPEEGFRAWLQLLEEEDQKLFAWFKRHVGPEGDWQEAYRQWYQREQDKKLEELIRVARRREHDQAIEEAKITRARESRRHRRRLLGSIASRARH